MYYIISISINIKDGHFYFDATKHGIIVLYNVIRYLHCFSSITFVLFIHINVHPYPQDENLYYCVMHSIFSS